MNGSGQHQVKTVDSQSLEGQLTKDDFPAEQQALAHAKSALVESAATEVVSIGHAVQRW
jgi:hypothetical protein